MPVSPEELATYRAAIKPSAGEVEEARAAHEAAQAEFERVKKVRDAAFEAYCLIGARDAGALPIGATVEFKGAMYRITSQVMSRRYAEIDSYKTIRIKKDGSDGAARTLYKWDFRRMTVESLPSSPQGNPKI